MKNANPTLRVASIVVTLAAAVVLLAAGGRHAHTYYQLLRWGTTGAAALLVWRGAAQGMPWAWALAPVAILFNPVAPIHLSRDTWQTLDIAAAVVIVLAVALMEIATTRRKKP
jgi:hypothetical protein